MKKSVALSIIFSCIFISAFADNVLSLTNPKTNQSDIFRKGSYVVFGIKADKSVHEGFIREITDSSLVFDNSQVSLSQIDILAGNTRERIRAEKTAETVAAVLIVGGITALCVASAFTFQPNYHFHHHADFYPHVWINLGYAINWNTLPVDRSVHLRNYGNWSAAIVKEELPETKSEKDSPKPEKQKKKKNKTGDEVYGN
ncbi:MAG: hypothetical protein HY063_00690 [Bacteroidetes bacterium]|nr:hypothetical protein [Bacteroidota bacterium]